LTLNGLNGVLSQKMILFSLLFFPLAHENRKCVENKIYWSIANFGEWRNGVHQRATK
jgi:hypothetical protein